MKPKLPRIFLWRDRRYLEDFVRHNPINRELYGLFSFKEKKYRFRVSFLDMLNEAYYQCTKVVFENDPNPSFKGYEIDIKANLGLNSSTKWVFLMMYAILSARKNNTIEVNRFKDSFDLSYFLILENKDCTTFIERTKELSGKFDIDLSPEPPYPISKLNNLDIYWPEVTCGYDMEAIRKLLELWDNPDDKLKVIGMIETAYREIVPVNYSMPLFYNSHLDLTELKEEISQDVQMYKTHITAAAPIIQVQHAEINVNSPGNIITKTITNGKQREE